MSNIKIYFLLYNLFLFQVHRAEKVAFAGQGTVAGEQVLMPSTEHNTVTRMDLQTLSTRALPPLPISTRYEAIFYLHFWCCSQLLGHTAVLVFVAYSTVTLLKSFTNIRRWTDSFGGLAMVDNHHLRLLAESLFLLAQTTMDICIKA